MKMLLISGFAAACLAGAATAHAKDVTMRVNAADIDLSSQSDVSKLRKRVLKAANTACGVGTYTVTYVVDAACVQSALNDADKQISDLHGKALAVVDTQGSKVSIQP